MYFCFYLGYNNRLRSRFGFHPLLWSFIQFLKGEQSLVLMRLTHIRNGNYSSKALPFSSANDYSRRKTKQIQNLARLYEIGRINLSQYLSNLSIFVGNSTFTEGASTNDVDNSSVNVDISHVDENNNHFDIN